MQRVSYRPKTGEIPTNPGVYRFRDAEGRVLYVGDSTPDFCVSGRADFVLAKYKLIAHCESRGIAHAPFEHFTQATALLDKVVLGLEALA